MSLTHYSVRKIVYEVTFKSCFEGLMTKKFGLEIKLFSKDCVQDICKSLTFELFSNNFTFFNFHL
jgi:hypothetical protein